MMLAHLADVSVRSILLALFASVVLWLLARRSTAALQHAVWASVVCGMLALLAFGQVLPKLPLRLPHRATGRASAIQQTAPSVIAQPATIEIPLHAKASKPIDWSVLGAYAYGAVALAFLAHLAVGMFFARRLLAGAPAIPDHSGVYESGHVAVPVAVGWLRPRILLPLEWCEWDRDKLDAVLAHEGAHVRRHDGFVAALAGVNRCLFWFHPLAWMLEDKLAELAEQACDEFCVAILGDCERYARLLLEVARMANGSRLRRHALTMAASSHIGKRIDALLEEGRTFSRGLTWSAWTAVALCGIGAVWSAGAVELLAQAPAPPARPAAQASPAFEVATIKPNKSGGGATLVPGLRNGTLSARNVTLKELILTAYGVSDRQIVGPAWLDADHFDLAGKAPKGVPDTQLMPPLQNLLKDRFQLAVHRETKVMPAFDMVVAKGGPKITPFDPTHPIHPPAGYRGRMMFGVGTMRELAMKLTIEAGKAVLDKTGMNGRYSFMLLSWAPGPGAAETNGAVDDAAPDFFAAVEEQLGLKLVPKNEPVELIVVDGANRTPVEN